MSRFSVVPNTTKIHGQEIPEKVEADKNPLDGSYGAVRDNKEKAIEAAKIERKKLQQMNMENIPDSRKKKILKMLDSAIKDLEKPGARAAAYNKLMKAVRESKAARQQQLALRNKGSKSGTGSDVAGPSQKSQVPDQLTDVPGESGFNDASLSDPTRDLPDVGSTGGSKFGGTNPEEFADMMLENPEKAMQKMENMGMKEMNALMTATQMYMQRVQRMFKMQSNIAKAAHRTSDSIIGNIR